MQEKLIAFETAVLAKEKGFDIETLHFYTKPRAKMFGIDKHGRDYPIKNKSSHLYIAGKEATLHIESVYHAPTQSLLQKWIREVHNIIVEVMFDEKAEDGFPWLLSIYNNKIEVITETHNLFGTYWDNYEEALEAGLREALTLIK